LGDLKSFQARYFALRQSMIDDGLSLGLPFYPEDLQTLAERLTKEGTSFVLVTLPLLGKALDSGLVSGTFTGIPNFRQKRNTCLPHFMYSLFRRIFGDDGILLLTPCVDSIRFLRLFLLFDSKLKYEPTVKQEDQAVLGFSARMEANRKIRIPKDDPVLREAKSLLGRVLSTLDLSVIAPGHGPGVVAERKDRIERWEFSSWPLKAEKVYPYLTYGAHSIRAVLERGVGVPLTRVSYTRCCLVPKDFKGPRLISAENTVNQYLQQGQMKALMSFIDRHPLLSKSIKLRDQTFNQKRAQEAVAQNLVTLDLSDASDTVSATLVWYLLSDVPKLRKQLMATRSDYMVWKDQKIRITAFAPMGSATCFPIETLVFWAISMASIRQACLNPVTLLSDRSYNEYAQSLAVFGDDIIIPDYALDICLDTLLKVGCKPNKSKTCVATPFRESCGSDWYNGEDVTIIRNRLYAYERNTFKDQPVLCDLQRKFFVKGFYKTAALLAEWANYINPIPTLAIRHVLNVSVLKRMGWTALLERELIGVRLVSWILRELTFFEKQSLATDRFPFLLGFYSCTAGSKLRWNRSYQRWECRVMRPFQGFRDWVSGGYPRLHARLSGDQAERIAIRTLHKVKMAWSHIPIPPDFHQADKSI
jgi:hypothetical protein